jgi:hypothetical protein
MKITGAMILKIVLALSALAKFHERQIEKIGKDQMPNI